MAAPARLQSALVLGAGGTLGAALLAQALVAGRFQRVRAAICGPLTSAVRGLDPWTARGPQDTQSGLEAELAFIVFERGRAANGRDDSFLTPAPADLLAWARTLRGLGATRLLVVLPHSPSLLPKALEQGFGSLAEAAVAALGWQHLVFVKPSRPAAEGGGQEARPASGLQRFAHWWLSQLSWMVPQQEQPLRAAQLAGLVVQLARLLPQAPPGIRVVPQALLWRASRLSDPQAELRDWLDEPEAARGGRCPRTIIRRCSRR